MIREMLALGGLLLLEPSGTAGPIGFSTDTLLEHRIGGETSVEVPAVDRQWYGETQVRVTIGADGSVTDASIAKDGNRGEQDPAPALAAARALKFRPFTYRGAPVTAVGTVSIRYVPGGRGGWRDRDAALPPIDYAHLKITLIRSACFGSCPDYRVTIDGAGNVEFTTGDDSVPGAPEVHRAFSAGPGVVVGGTHRATIDRPALDALIERFRAVHFFGLRQEYRAGVTDNPTQVLGFSSGGHHWEVVDYVGGQAGMPAAVTALEDAVDAAAGTSQWVSGDARTVPALIAEGLDPRGEDAAMLAFASLTMRRSDGRVAADLIAAGLPLDATLKLPGGTTMGLDDALREVMTRQPQPLLLRLLIARGWLQRLSRDQLDTLFIASGAGCDADIARAMIAAGARINAVEKPVKDGTGFADTALESAVAAYGPCRSLADRGAFVSALIGLGADPNLRDNQGHTAIFGLEDPDLLELLLAAGARADIKGNDNLSAIFWASTDVIVLRLLDAGADPHGRSHYAKQTLRQMAQEGDMPATLAWLDAHGVK
jgi:Domain of unknown function (DUF6438)/Gram-negative bacterial TonB protein C-terminal